MRFRVRIAAGLVSLAAGVALSAPATSLGAVTCTHSGGDHLLSVNTADAFTKLDRSGQEIEVASTSGPVDCAGGKANVNNTDLIQVSHSGQHTDLIDLGGGLFEPGFAQEPVGLPEIEIQYLDRSYVDVRATAGADRLALGAGGVNLNPDDDVDLTGDFSTLLLEGRGGDDVIEPQFPYAGSNGRRILNGGPGSDTIISTPDGAVLHGGDDNDKLIGGRKSDNLTGGTGVDVMKGRGGPDLIRAIDDDSDRVNCGKGVDRVKLDGIDKAKNCERVLRIKRRGPVGKKG
jgi:RTX calcium-binding nonapeptide repeat (4 copies)